jgi:hypothetical protein
MITTNSLTAPKIARRVIQRPGPVRSRKKKVRQFSKYSPQFAAPDRDEPLGRNVRFTPEMLGLGSAY